MTNTPDKPKALPPVPPPRKKRPVRRSQVLWQRPDQMSGDTPKPSILEDGL